MITDGNTTEIEAQFLPWYQKTVPYAAQSDRRRYASFHMTSNGMSFQCESTWIDVVNPAGRRYRGSALRIELYSLSAKHASGLLQRSLAIIVQHHHGHVCVVMPLACDIHGLQLVVDRLQVETVVSRSSGRKERCWFLLGY